MAKKARSHRPVPNRRRAAVGIGLIILTIAVVLVGIMGYHSLENTSRASRIRAIYAGLNLPESYQLSSSNVFGDKRPYDWGGDAGKGRTYSSSQTYEVGKTVDAAVSDVRHAIEHEGFHYIGEPYPGSAYIEYHFRSDKGEYIRLTVSSKIRDDAIRNDALLGRQTTAALELDPKAAPSNVLIKVNLDDNNE